MTTSLPFTASDICAHGDALRRLAHALLGDRELAQDAVQEAWLKALAQPPRSRAALPRWLMQVVHRCALDLRRGDRRRVAREAVAARPEATPADAAESLAVQHEILAAVRALREPYRTVVWLRYYEDLAPAAIAERLGEPVKTVKTRLWRALRILREKLDGQEQHRDWRAALLPLAMASPGGRAAGAVWVIGAWLMQMAKTTLAVAGVLAAVGLWFLWSSVGAGGAEPGVTTVAPEGKPGEPVVASPATSRAQRDQLDPTPAASAPAGDSYGSLLVRAVWHDDSPAEGVAILFVAEAEPAVDRNDLRVRTDAQGIARAARLHAGVVRLSCERGGEMSAELVAGKEQQVRFTIPSGIDVAGVVEDGAGQPVASARIWLANGRAGWQGGRVVTTAGSGGRFTLRSVDRRHSLGALAPGFAPSALVDLEDVVGDSGPSPVELRLQLLHKGAAVTGQVLDERGQPVAAALVAVGTTRLRGPDRRTEAWTPEVMASGADGRFGCDGVEPGVIPVEVRADGYALWVGKVMATAGATADVTVTLARGVMVHGTVTDEQRRAVGGALVLALLRPFPKAFLTGSPAGMGDETRAFKRPQTVADAHGRYRLQCVPPGDVHLLAGKWNRGPICLGTRQETLPARSGEELEWNPVLSRGLTIRGRVVDAEGKPYSHTILEATPDTPAEGAELVFAFARDGRFEFIDCADVPYTVSLQAVTRPHGAGWVYQTGVRPGGPEVVLTIPRARRDETGRIQGRVVDSGRRVTRGSELRVSLLSHGSRYATVEGDRFHLDRLEPGRYRVIVSAKDDPVLLGPWFDLASGQQLDVGDLVTQPGASLSITLRTPPGIELGSPSGSAYCPEVRSLAWDGRRLRADNLSAGACRLWLGAGMDAAWYDRPRNVTLVAGQETQVEVDVVPAVFRRIEITFPPPDLWHEATVVLRDARGGAVAENRYHAASVGLRPMSLNGPKPVGTFMLEVTTDAGHRKSWPVDLSDPATAERVLRFSLR